MNGTVFAVRVFKSIVKLNYATFLICMLVSVVDRMGRRCIVSMGFGWKGLEENSSDVLVLLIYPTLCLLLNHVNFLHTM